MTKEFSEAEGVTTLSDLEGMTVTLAAAPDCEGRLDCEGGLSDEYGIDVTEVLPLGYASDQTYQSVLDGESELGETSTTDGTLESQGLVVLEDDKQIQPAQNLVPAIGSDFLAEHEDIADILNPLMAALTTEKLTELNGRIAVDREKPEDVATDFLRPRACSSCLIPPLGPRAARKASAAASTSTESSTLFGTSSVGPPPSRVLRRRAAVQGATTSSPRPRRRPVLLDQPAGSRCTGGRPLCTSDRSPQSSCTPSRSSSHHSSAQPGIPTK